MAHQEDSVDQTNNTSLGFARRPFLKLAGAAGIIASSSAAAEEGDDEGSEMRDSEEKSSGKPHVHLFGTGGTIADPEGSGYLSPEELVERWPQVDEIASISVTAVTELGSSRLRAQELYTLHDEIMRVANGPSPPDGMVVTHGSNTVEETAYFLNMTLNTNIPVVTTAAQRGVDELGTDSPKNFFDAIRVAAHSEAVKRGVLFVANDEVHHARDVTKLVSSRPDGWKSPNLGRVGLAELDDIHFYRTTERVSYPETEFDISNTTPNDYPLSDVEIVYSALGSTGQMVDAAVDAGIQGFVVAGLPTGRPSRPEGMRGQLSALEDAAESGRPVVAVQRGTEGKIKSEDASELFVGGDTLSPQKARLLLALGLMKGCDRKGLQRLFDIY